MGRRRTLEIKEGIPLSQFFANVPSAKFSTGHGRGNMTVCLKAVYYYPASIEWNLTTADWGWNIGSFRYSGKSLKL